MARLTSDLFVSAMLNNAQARGIFGGVISKGFSTAGAVHIVCYDQADASYAIYSPAPQVNIDEQAEAPVGGRLFEWRGRYEIYQDLLDFIASEKRFDADLWVVELEADVTSCAGLFSIVERSN